MPAMLCYMLLLTVVTVTESELFWNEAYLSYASGRGAI